MEIKTVITTAFIISVMIMSVVPDELLKKVD